MTHGETELTVGQVAQQYGVTVRTLHHYDEIGLLTPSERTYAGYRVYGAADVERLATIVVYRRLGFGLDEIGELLDGSAPVVDHLRRQKAVVLERIGELNGLVTAIDSMMEAQMSARPVTDAELKEIFGDGFGEDYPREAEERWGETDAWAQSQGRTPGYSKADWEQIKADMDATNAAFAAALDAGEPADSQAAMDAAEEARLHIHTRFYDCSHEFHRGLGDLYVTDPRFTATYEQIRPGLAQYVRDAIHANADRAAAG